MRRMFGVLVLGALILGGAGTQAQAEEHAYIGAKKCKMCHLKEYNSWAETKMAKSFELLKPGVGADAKKAHNLDPQKDYTADKDCVGCHTTGYGKPGGFVDVATTPGMVGVQCESCHGPGGTYTKKEHMSLQNKEYKLADIVAVGLVSPITKAQCINCHNNKSPFVGADYVFDFEKKKTEGTHEKFPLKYKH